MAAKRLASSTIIAAVLFEISRFEEFSNKPEYNKQGGENSPPCFVTT
jgi:hypothetical protein